VAIVVPDLDLIDSILFFGDLFPARGVFSYFPYLNLVAANRSCICRKRPMAGNLNIIPKKLGVCNWFLLHSI
jgi:hypothetical protein